MEQVKTKKLNCTKIEKRLIREALQKSDGVQTKAAKLLSMSERHLRYKLQKYKMK
ncbi:MAG: hypothetical protein GWP06_18940 [Actinobacteria bacterium]|nr:hypothetical protein [Actinomycetota bacterium]